MDFEAIRKTVIIAMFSDNVLFEKLTLKGGNALRLVHGIGSRASIDVDLSLQDDFEDLEDVRMRIFKALRDRFDSEGYVVFDERVEPRPRDSRNEVWGGYEVEFKLISKEKQRALNGNIERMRIQAETVAPLEHRRFKIQISKHEYCEGRRAARVDDYVVYVYTLEMIVVEKLRAICQQMPEYAPGRSHPAPRARDFYDIHQLRSKKGISLNTPATIELFEQVFAAKGVPLKLLRRIGDYREFHRPDWPSVVQSVSEELEPFDYYFDALIALVEELQPPGME